jgi:hypothetical protein
VHAVEALVDEPAHLGHDPLALLQVDELDRPRPLALVALAQAPDPRQQLELGRHAPRRGQERAHLLARVRRQLARRVERDQVRVGVGDPALVQLAKSASISATSWACSSQRCSSQTAFLSWLKGMRGVVAERRVGEVHEPRRAGDEPERGEAARRAGPASSHVPQQQHQRRGVSPLVGQADERARRAQRASRSRARPASASRGGP